MSIVVVEGMDGSGKTTLIEKSRGSQKDRYFAIIRASRYPPDVKTAVRYLSFVDMPRNIDLVLDRFHFISDRIYGPILRGADIFQEFPIQFGLAHVNVVVYARPPVSYILDNLHKNLQLSGVTEQATALINRYDNHMDKLKETGVVVMQYDYTNDDPMGFWNSVWERCGAYR